MKTLFIFITITTIMFFIQLQFLKLLLKKTHNIFCFKVLSVRLSLFICFSYAFVFIFLLYFIRLLNRNHLLDLKSVYYSSLPYFFNLPNFIIISFFLMVVLCVTIFFSVILLIHQIAANQFFCLFLYCNHSFFLENNKYTKYIYALFDKDYSIIVRILLKIYIHLSQFLHDLEIALLLRPNTEYDPSPIITKHKYFILNLLRVLIMGFDIKGYRIKFVDPLLKSTPLFLFLYDLFFNDCVITHVYQFLPYYMPIIVFQNISHTIGGYNGGVGDCLWEMYYKKEHCIYLGSQKIVDILHFFFNNKLDTLKLFKALPDGYDTALPILDAINGGLLRFTLSDEKKNIYENCVIPFPGIMYVQKIGNRFFLISDFDEKDNPILDEEYFVILDKTLTNN